MATKTIETGICRFDLDNRGAHGYMVRIMRRGRMYQEFFSDSVWGGKRLAKRAARERHAELSESLPASKPQKGRKTVRNTTGKVGVHLTQDVDRRNEGYEYAYWSYVASWVNPRKKRINVRFSWNKYGEDAAFEMACIAREKETQDREEITKVYERRKAAREKRTAAAEAKAERAAKRKAAKKKTANKKASRKVPARSKAVKKAPAATKKKAAKRGAAKKKKKAPKR